MTCQTAGYGGIDYLCGKHHQMKEVVVKNISIGDELLIGQVINTNAAWLGEHLSLAGFRLSSVLTVGDSEKAITEALNSCLDASLVIVTGGLGPTADDITKPTLCKFFDTELVLNDEVFQNILSIFKLRGFEMTERNRQQAFVPKDCICIPNLYGTVPCMWIERNDTVFVFLPGVPFEMKGIFTDELLERFKKRFHSTPYEQRVIMTTGIGESFLADKIHQWEEELPDYMALAYLPQHGIVRLRLSGTNENENTLHEALDKEVAKLAALIPDNIFSMEDVHVERVVFDLLKQHRLTMSSAESCTGGNIGHRITLIPGSSAVYKGTVVSYATEVKSGVLDVPPKLIDEYGLVSREVVESMACNVRQLMKTDFGLATTGIAGPDGGTIDTPLGTVWIALAAPDGVVSECFNFGNDRENTIERASVSAFEMLRQWLLHHFE